jgi:hypothetical protein
MKKFTKFEIRALEARGWEFVPIGPNEWTWIKFDKDGNVSSFQGDSNWRSDLRRIDADYKKCEMYLKGND